MKVIVDEEEYQKLMEIIKMSRQMPVLNFCKHSSNGIRCQKFAKVKFGSEFCYNHQPHTSDLCMALNKNKEKCFFKAKEHNLCNKHNKQIDYMLSLI